MDARAAAAAGVDVRAGVVAAAADVVVVVVARAAAAVAGDHWDKIRAERAA